MTQEQENLIRDLTDMVNNHSKTINKMAKVINAQQVKINEFENELLKLNTNVNYNDIFRTK